MVDFHEVYLLTQRQEEWVFIHKKDVACEEDLLVQLYQYYSDIHLIHGHYIRIFHCSLSFKCCNALAPYLLHNFNILDCHCTLLDLVATNHPFVLLSLIIDDCGVENPSNFCTLDLSHCEAFFVIRDGVVKSELLIPWVK